MITETIGYRYSQEELGALLMLLRLSPPPGMACDPLNREDFERVCDGLQQAGLLLRLDDTMAVDRLSAFLLTTASKCGSWLSLSGGGTTLCLWRGPSCFVMGRLSEQGPVQLTPLRDAKDAIRAFCAEPISLPAALTGSEGQTINIDSRKALSAAVHEALNNKEG